MKKPSQKHAGSNPNTSPNSPNSFDLDTYYKILQGYKT